MKAFITLLSTEDYLDAVLVLNASLRDVSSKYPLVCAITEDLKENSYVVGTLKKESVKIEFIKRLAYSEYVTTKWRNHSVLNTASKISLFDLKQYEKLVYIDADTIVLKNIDDVMSYPDGAMVRPTPAEFDSDEYGFTGLFVFQPLYHKTEFYKNLLENFPCADGDLLGNLWFFTRTSSAHQIPYPYLTQYSYYYYHNQNYPAKVIHFCNEEKPWKTQYYEYFESLKDPIFQTYKDCLNKIHHNTIFSG